MSSPQQALEKLQTLSNSPSLVQRKSLRLSLDQLTINIEQQSKSKRRNTVVGLFRQREKTLQREDLKFGNLIGRGAVGSVFSCTYTPTRGKYAMKLFDLSL